MSCEILEFSPSNRHPLSSRCLFVALVHSASTRSIDIYIAEVKLRSYEQVEAENRIRTEVVYVMSFPYNPQ